MPNQALVPVRSIEATHFLEALATNAASAMVNLPIPTPGVRRWYIRAAQVVGLEPISPEFSFFSTAAGVNADPGLDTFAGSVAFFDADAKRFGAAGVYRWWTDGMQVPCFDADSANQVGIPNLHVVLVNRSATGKSAGAPGNLQVTFWLEPITGGY